MRIEDCVGELEDLGFTERGHRSSDDEFVRCYEALPRPADVFESLNSGEEQPQSGSPRRYHVTFQSPSSLYQQSPLALSSDSVVNDGTSDTIERLGTPRSPMMLDADEKLLTVFHPWRETRDSTC